MGALRPYPSLFLPNLLRPNLLRPKSWVQFIKITQDRPLALLHSRPTNLIHMTLNTDLVYQKCAALYRCSSCNHPSSDLIPDPKYKNVVTYIGNKHYGKTLLYCTTPAKAIALC